MKRTYSPEEKEEALAVCVECGQYRASKQLGIPQSTIADWAKRAGVRSTGREKVRAAAEAHEAYCAAKRAELKKLLIAKAVDLVGRMDEPHIDFKTSAGARPTTPTSPSIRAWVVERRNGSRPCLSATSAT